MDQRKTFSSHEKGFSIVREPQSRSEMQTDTSKSTVAVIGLGYVGLPLALLLGEKKYDVIGIDTDEKKVAAIARTRHVSYLTDKENEKLRHSTMQVDTRAALLSEAHIIVVCVPTPVRDNHEPDLAPLESACYAVADHIMPGTLVVIESTVNPGVCDELVIPLIERVSGLRAGEDFFIAHCPERINPGDTTWDVSTIPRVVGANDPESFRRVTEFYNSLIETPVFSLPSIKEAEAVKIVENSFRDINIAFVNELAISFDRIGIDITRVIEAASTKPFAFMAHYPGCGVGGHCIPVDPYYLISYAARNGFSHRFLSLAREINNNMPAYTVDLLEEMLSESGKGMRGARIALLGIAYKRNVADTRESPALAIKQELEKRGAHVRLYDPYATHESTVENVDGALAGAHAAVIATDHDAFRDLTPETLLSHNVSILVDGKNCLSKDEFLSAGIAYKGIGR